MKLRKLISAITAAAVMATSFVFSAVPASAETITATNASAGSILIETTGVLVTSLVIEGTAQAEWNVGGCVQFNANGDGNQDWNNLAGSGYQENYQVDTGDFTISLTPNATITSDIGVQVWWGDSLTISKVILNGTTIFGAADEQSYMTNESPVAITETNLEKDSVITVTISDAKDDAVVAIGYKGTDGGFVSLAPVEKPTTSSVEFTLTAEQAELINKNGGLIAGSGYVYKSYTAVNPKPEVTVPDGGTLVNNAFATVKYNEFCKFDIDTSKLTTNTYYVVGYECEDGAPNLIYQSDASDNWNWHKIPGTASDGKVTFNAADITKEYGSVFTNIFQIGVQFPDKGDEYNEKVDCGTLKYGIVFYGEPDMVSNENPVEITEKNLEKGAVITVTSGSVKSDAKIAIGYKDDSGKFVELQSTSAVADSSVTFTLTEEEADYINKNGGLIGGSNFAFKGYTAVNPAKRESYTSYGFMFNSDKRWESTYSGKILADDTSATIDIYYDAAAADKISMIVQSPNQTVPYSWWGVYSLDVSAGTDLVLKVPVTTIAATAGESNPSDVIRILFEGNSNVDIYKVDYNSFDFISTAKNAEALAYSPTIYAPAPGEIIVDMTSTAKGNEKKLDDYYTKTDDGWVTTNDSIFRNPEARLVINYTDAEHDGWGDIGVVIEDENGNKSQAVITTSQGSNLEAIVPIKTALNKMEAAGGGAAADKGKIVGGSIVGWNGCVINKVEVIIDESKTLSKEEAAEAAAAPEAAIVEVADLNASGQLTVYSKDKTESILSDPDGILYVVYDNAADGGTISIGLPKHSGKGWGQYNIEPISAGKDAELKVKVSDIIAGIKADDGYTGIDDVNGSLLIQTWGGPVLKAAKYEKSASAGAADAAEQAAAELGDIAVKIEEATGLVEIDATGAELAVALLSADDLEKVKNGAEFKVKITAKEIEDTADYKAAVDELVDNIVTGIFVDVEIFTQVGDDAEKQVTETNYPVQFTVYSDELAGFDGAVYGFRFHDGDIDEIDVTYDAETGAAELKSDKYSVFAIVLAEVFSSDIEIDIDDTTAEGGNPSDTGASTGVVDAATDEETNPHTGVALTGFAVLTAAGALAVLSKKRRK